MLRPRVEQRKWILAKKTKILKKKHNQKQNHQQNNSTGRATRKIEKQEKTK